MSSAIKSSKKSKATPLVIVDEEKVSEKEVSVKSDEPLEEKVEEKEEEELSDDEKSLDSICFPEEDEKELENILEQEKALQEKKMTFLLNKKQQDTNFNGEFFQDLQSILLTKKNGSLANRIYNEEQHIAHLKAEVERWEGLNNASKMEQEAIERKLERIGSLDLENKKEIKKVIQQEFSKEAKDYIEKMEKEEMKPIVEKAKAVVRKAGQTINDYVEGTKWIMTYNKSGRIYTKRGGGVVGEDGKEYKSLNEVIKKYKIEIGDTKKFGSAWSMFREYV
jgi:hypothetical protein